MKAIPAVIAVLAAASMLPSAAAGDSAREYFEKADRALVDKDFRAAIRDYLQGQVYAG